MRLVRLALSAPLSTLLAAGRPIAPGRLPANAVTLLGAATDALANESVSLAR